MSQNVKTVILVVVLALVIEACCCIFYHLLDLDNLARVIKQYSVKERSFINIGKGSVNLLFYSFNFCLVVLDLMKSLMRVFRDYPSKVEDALGIYFM